MLPKWLAEPDVIARDIKSNLIPLSDMSGICPLLRKKLEANGIQTFFPGQRYRFMQKLMTDFIFSSLFHHIPLLLLHTVQAEVIPAVLESVNSGLLIGRGGYRPRDICVSAPTGSGKTLAFVIPVVQVRRSVQSNKAFYSY